MALQRSGLPLLIIAAILLLVSAGVVYLVANPFGDAQPGTADAADSESADQPDARPDQTPEPEPEPETGSDPAAPAEPAAEPEPVEPESVDPEPDTTVAEPTLEAPDAETIPASTRTVRSGDSLYSISGVVWDDPFLWPLLLVANDDDIADPDYLRPGTRLAIPEWTTVESPLSNDQRVLLSDAHVTAYEHYRSLGANAVGLGQGQPQWWLDRLGRTRDNNARWVLYSGLRYNEDLLDDFSARIAAADLREVRGYVTRFGLPPTRR